MTPEAIRTAVLADPELKALAEVGIDNQIAAALTAGQPAVPKSGVKLGELGIYDLLGPEAGEVFLQGLEAVAVSQSPMAPILARIVRWLRSESGVDVGNPTLQANLLALVQAGAVTAESAAAVIAHGSHKPPVTADQVSDALAVYRPEGKAGPINP